MILSDGSGGNTAGRWYKADADQTYLSSAAPTLGFALTAVASAASGTFRISGRVTGLSSLTAGLTYYVSATAGGLTSTPPTNVRTVGVADTTTSLVISFALTTPASATTAGIVSLADQTLGAGVKTFSSPPVGLPKFARCTAALTQNNTGTVANITGLSFAVAASEVWAFQFYLYGKSSDVADWKFVLTGPTAPTSIIYGVQSSQDQPALAETTAFGNNVFAGGANSTEQALILHGLLRNGSNAGTVQIQMAQSTAEVSDTVIRAESYLLAWRIS